MRIITVIENTCKNEKYAYEHGLCVYIETKKHKLLLDTGASSSFIENMKLLKINIKDIDTVILSHGHYDHAGGIIPFSKLNNKAKIYMQETANNDYYHGEKYIGIDKDILDLSNVCLKNDDYQIDDELFVFTHVTDRQFWPKSNLELSKIENNKLIQDDFSHEQYLVVSQDGKHILFSGCAHNGILNILKQYQNLYHAMPDVVISGFHMKKKTEYSEEDIEIIKQTARQLNQFDTIFYTGHCTGEVAFGIMHEIMGNQLKHLHSGEDIDLR